jgi:hypothetical protein
MNPKRTWNQKLNLILVTISTKRLKEAGCRAFQRGAWPVRGITYAMDLDFDDLAIKNRVDQANLDRTLAEGDKNGWNSTVDEKNNIAALKARLKTLEDNARKRGDMVIPR